MDHNKYVLANSVGFQITDTAKLVTHRLNLNFRNNDFPVTHEQWSIMIRLWEENGLTQNKLANLTRRDQPSVSRLVDNLEKSGLVTRMPHPIDKRTNLIFLTAKGKKLQVGLIRQAFKTIEEISEGIDPDEMKIFLKVLSKVNKNLS